MSTNPMIRFRPYLGLLKPVRFQFVLAILAGMVAAGASTFGLPFMLEKVFPIVFPGDAEQKAQSEEDLQKVLDFVGIELPQGATFILFACMLLPTVFFVRGLAGFINVYYVNFCGLKVLEAIRVKTYDKLQRLSLNFHHKQSEGDLLSRLLTDTNLIQNVMVRVACDLIVQPCHLVGALAYLTYASLKDSSSFFMLIALFSVPICVFPIRHFGKKLLAKSRTVQGKLGDMTSMVSENLASQREIRAYNLQDKEVAGFQKETSLFLKFQLKVVKYSYMISPVVEIIAAFGVAVAIYMGVQQGLTLQKFLPLVAALYFAYSPVKKLGKVHGTIRTGEAALVRIEEVLNSDDQIPESSNAQKIENLSGLVELKGVNFGYDDEPVLKNINVTIPAGQTVALVGRSGAGKSSFVSLIPRFYEASSGAVKVDDIDIKEIDKSSLRHQIALVSQSPLLFKGTIAENIRIGKDGATDEEVEAAAKQAIAHDFITALPKGYQTVVGERGEGLSGGQRQRVAIARAFLRDAPILIMDEATSALDAESEAMIQEELAASAKRTTFLIAHRFSSIRHADRILVFSNLGQGGEIIADGTHEELYQTCSHYKELYDRQS